jgi:hypothetical protein
MEHSSISTIFSQSKALRQRIDSLQRQGLSPEEAITQAKMKDSEPTCSLKKINSSPFKSNPNLRNLFSSKKDCLLGQSFRTDPKDSTIYRRKIIKSLMEKPPACHVKSEFQKPIQSKMDLLRLGTCGIGYLICTGALIAFGSKAGGNTAEALFWSSLIVISSSILLALPFRWWLVRSWIQKALGLILIGIGYVTMHASIASTEQRSVGIAVVSTTGVHQIEKSIADLEQRLKPTRDAIARLDPVDHRKLIARMQSDSKPLENELAATRQVLIQAKEKAATHTSIETVSSWSWVEWLRRLALEPLNILCLHGFIEAWPQAMNALRRRRIRLAQLAT